MFLQRIELQGFKSFANKTVLEFPSPARNATHSVAGGPAKMGKDSGITAIVGPNGSGKSNIVDAVRWVLGEQSLKLLRGKKSTDVIFSGSIRKSQQSLAEVSLFLNNEDNSAPIDYAEVAITRKIYRDGSSEYLLNKQEVRLFDIVMLLAKANFGHNTYSIIGQGMVDKLVNFSNEERKEFFDEATGVKQFQIKRERSVSKLKRSRENLGQARVLTTELEPHLKSLTRQVNKLRQRQEIELELKNIQTLYYGRMWQDLSIQYDEFALSYNTYDKQRLRLENKLSELHSRLEEIQGLGSRAEEYDKLQEEYNQSLSKQNESLRELALLRGKLETEYDKAGKHDLSYLENRKSELEQKIKDLTADTKTSRLKLESNTIKLTEKERQIKIISDELLVWQNNLDIMQEDYYRLKNGGKSNHQFEAVREVLSQKDKISGICGTVSDLGKIKNQRSESALVAAAGNRLSAVVVENDAVAVECINWLKSNRLPAVTFYPLNRLKEFYLSKEAEDVLGMGGVVGLASDLISYDRKYQKVFEQVFGNTVIVENLEAAKNIGINRERMVTLDGDVLEKTGVMRGGFRKPDSLAWKTLEDKFFPEAKIKEIAALKAKIEDQRSEREGLFLQIGDLKAVVQTEGERAKNFYAEVEASRKELEKVTADLSASGLSPEEHSELMKETLIKKETAEAVLKEVEEALLILRDRMDKFNLEEEKKKQEIFSIQQETYNLQNELNRINTELGQVKIDLARVETRREDVLSAIRENLGDAWEFSHKSDYSQVNLEEDKNRIDRLKKQLEMIGGIDPEIEKEYEEVKTRFEFLTEQSLDLETAIKDLEKVVVELDKLIKAQFEDEFEKINKDFSRYFKQLFDGGTAKLSLIQKEEEQTEAEIIREQIAQAAVPAGLDAEEQNLETNLDNAQPKKIIYPEDKSFLANMGIEIEACPPGKKIKAITMLSGGEKTMTALALICSIINNNPSPFILFDEVDAALDESNSSKLSRIVKELAHKTQFIIITHNRAIMSEADVLYGVTMQGDGVSRLISLKLSEIEQIETV
ncbi:MAG: AAA family ATPase [Candidatus Buchananbacteria bacterium]|jgi:chromosome segregation protein